jgi:hypothetical protein
MAGRVPQLKDEVCSACLLLYHENTANNDKGTQTQVVIAGAAAGLVSRYTLYDPVRPFWLLTYA